MKRKVLSAFLGLLLIVTSSASASLASLEEALSPILNGQGPVRMSVHLNAKTLMPFDEKRLELINRILEHMRLDILLDADSADAVTGFQLALGGMELFEVSEQTTGDTYLLQTSLLPNRMLFAAQASPMDTLLLSSQEKPVVDEESLDPNTSDVEEAFDMLAAVQELQGCYRTLIDQTVPLTDKNKVTYSIDNIGKGRTSYVAKLTTDQCEELQEEIRTILSCGMDAEYREELSQITFLRGFTVALYQNADGEDICVYIRGTIRYPDGDRRSLKWQWAFTPDGETQTFFHKVSREEGRRDTRNIEAILKQTDGSDGFTLKCETTANLRRGGKNETSTLMMEVSAGGDPLHCTGCITRETGGTYNGDDLDEPGTEVTFDLSLFSADAWAELTGTAVYRQSFNGSLQTELELSFVQTAETATQGAAQAQNAQPAVEISILPADAEAAQQAAQTPTVTAEETQTVQSEFLVGTPPVGLYDYDIPAEMTTIDMDSTQRKVHLSLMNEAAQRLAGNLVLAILNLPAEDRELLSDGMTEMDYSIFLAMLE